MPKQSRIQPETASQTVGPFVHIGLHPESSGIRSRSHTYGNKLASDNALGKRIQVSGYVIDGAGEHVTDALIEFWQADSLGRYPHPADPMAEECDPELVAFGRAVTDPENGQWSVSSIKPGSIPFGEGRQMAPHINLAIFARGINFHLCSRIYFDDEEKANAEDPVLQRISSNNRRDTLIATQETMLESVAHYRFDIVLQGRDETVFFDI